MINHRSEASRLWRLLLSWPHVGHLLVGKHVVLWQVVGRPRLVIDWRRHLEVPVRVGPIVEPLLLVSVETRQLCKKMGRHLLAWHTEHWLAKVYLSQLLQVMVASWSGARLGCKVRVEGGRDGRRVEQIARLLQQTCELRSHRCVQLLLLPWWLLL